MKFKVKSVRTKAFLFNLIFGVLLTTTAAAQTVNLQMQNDYTVGTAINTPIFTVGDLNNDRLPDLVTLNPNNLP